jgi:hypothetical protein
MRLNLLFIVMLIFFAFSFAQQKSPADSTGTMQSAKTQYTCPMHKNYRSQKPGECPTCGMDLIALNDQSNNEMKKMPMEQMEQKHDTSMMMGKKHVKMIKGKKHSHMMMEMKHDSASMTKGKKRDMKALMDKKFALANAGKYHCCIDGACNECVDEGECTCEHAVKRGTPVCDECYKGWKEGDGMVPGKTLKDIKHEEHRGEDKEKK